MRIYNTLTKSKEEFKTLVPGKVKMYVCGPTVYNFFHIGNARTFLAFDAVRRYLEYRGYEVEFVQNFTDIDDKMINKANTEGVTVKELGDRFIKEYYEDADGLKIERATCNPRATEHMTKIVEFVEGLIKKGYAYEVDGDVYFNTKSFKEYGNLSGQDLDMLQSGSRVNVDDRKKDPMDFAVWKAEKPDEPSWDSPWGMGRPGWHIECSCMAREILGDTIDIHAGGTDLVFPHHENEIAQSEAFTGKKFANYWMHCEYLNINNVKMSKSLNNFFTARELLEKYDPEVIRLFTLSGHYRTPLNFSLELLDSAKSGLERMYNTLTRLVTLRDAVTKDANEAADIALIKEINSFRDKFIEKMDDDFNTADGISVIFDLIKELNVKIDENVSKEVVEVAINLLRELGGPIGILQKEVDRSLEEEVEELIKQREQARKDKNWAVSDEIRDKLKAMGVVLEDTPQGVRWSKKN